MLNVWINRVNRVLGRQSPEQASIEQAAYEKGRAEAGRSQLSSSVMDAQIEQPRMEVPDISNENLIMFRLQVGIISHPSMDSTFRFTAGKRAAPNLGIYARVVHNEQCAKKGYKRMSLLINGCLGAQIVVAAALTALGAAGGKHEAVTAFGAINTVIAGILTFLKGSGLPSRLKYYQNEWKKVREYIEQRERDFSRPNCTLDPYMVVATVETMYEEVKLDTEANTPDRYAGVGNPRTMATSKPAGIMEFPKREVLSDKLKGLEAGFGHRRSAAEDELGRGLKDLEAGFGQRVHLAEEGLGHRTKDLEAGLGGRIHSEAADLESRAHEVQSSFGQKVRELEHFGSRLKDLASEIGSKAKDTARDAEIHGSHVIKEAESAAEHGKRMVDEGHAVGHADSSLPGAEKAGVEKHP